jgi:predicted acetyltransferase
VTFEFLGPGDADRTAYGEMISHAFGFPTAEAPAWFERTGHDNLRVLKDRGRVVAGLIVIPMGQFFGGKSVKMLGIAGVGVAPEARGRGVGNALMGKCVEEAVASGFVLSSLYGATTNFYLRLGWTRAAVRMKFDVELPMLEPLRVRGDGVSVEEVQGAPDELRVFYTEWAKGRSGHLDRGPQIWTRVTAPRGYTTKTFAVREHGQLTGYTVVSHKMDGDGGHVTAWCAAPKTKVAANALLSLYGSYSSVATTVTWFGSPAHPLLSAMPERRHKIELPWYLMTRTLDVSGALLARGYLRAAACDVSFEVLRKTSHLQEREAVRLVVEGGVAVILPCKRARLIMTEHGFTALYTGFAPARELFDLGEIRASGDPRDRDALESLDSVFTGPLPSIPDFF